MRLPDRGTIDATDDSAEPYPALTWARNANPNAGRHTNRKIAWEKLIALSGHEAAILGHGNRGLIVTGSGRLSNDSAKRIWHPEESLWKDGAKSLKGLGITALWLFACNTGAEAVGAHMMFRLAQLAECDCFATNGIIRFGQSGNFTLESGAVWLKATPTSEPDPLPKPRARLVAEVPAVTDNVRIRGRTSYEDIPVSEGTRVRVLEPSPGDRAVASTRGPELRGSAAARLLAHVDFERPEISEDVPLSILTGHLEIQSPDGEVRRFDILNDDLLQDVDHPDTYYRVDEGFAAGLEDR